MNNDKDTIIEKLDTIISTLEKVIESHIFLVLAQSGVLSKEDVLKMARSTAEEVFQGLKDKEEKNTENKECEDTKRDNSNRQSFFDFSKR